MQGHAGEHHANCCGTIRGGHDTGLLQCGHSAADCVCGALCFLQVGAQEQKRRGQKSRESTHTHTHTHTHTQTCIHIHTFTNEEIPLGWKKN